MTVIKIKNSAVAGKVPAAGALDTAELALNLVDQKLYSKDASGNIFQIGASGDVPSGGTGERLAHQVLAICFTTPTLMSCCIGTAQHGKR